MFVGGIKINTLGNIHLHALLNKRRLTWSYKPYKCHFSEFFFFYQIPWDLCIMYNISEEYNESNQPRIFFIYETWKLHYDFTHARTYHLVWLFLPCLVSGWYYQTIHTKNHNFYSHHIHSYTHKQLLPLYHINILQ